MDEPTVLVVMGVSGTGKTTVAEILAEQLGWSTGEGDDLHPEANVAKMAQGIPLTDEDRWPWLDTVAGWIRERLERGESGVVTCSALKRSYRDRLRMPGVRFVHLAGPRQLLVERMAARKGHYMPLSLLDSQLATLEVPGADEDVITASVFRAPEAIARDVLEQLRRG